MSNNDKSAAGIESKAIASSTPTSPVFIVNDLLGTYLTLSNNNIAPNNDVVVSAHSSTSEDSQQWFITNYVTQFDVITIRTKRTYNGKYLYLRYDRDTEKIIVSTFEDVWQLSTVVAGQKWKIEPLVRDLDLVRETLSVKTDNIGLRMVSIVANTASDASRRQTWLITAA